MPQFDIRKLLKESTYGNAAQIERLRKVSELYQISHQAELMDNFNFNKARLACVEPIKNLFGTYEGMNAVVVGAGPSAKENMGKIAELQRVGWMVVAVDMSWRKCIEGGVRPDMTISADAWYRVAELFGNHKIYETDKFGLNICTHPFVYERLKEGKIYAYANINPMNHAWDFIKAQYGYKWYGLRSGVTVTFSAIDFAMLAGAKKIALIGSDLMWDDDSQIDKSMYFTHQLIYLEGGGVTVAAFQRAAQALIFFPRDHKDVEFVNCSRGLEIGWKRQRIEDVLAEYKNKNVKMEAQKCECG